jgi:hypothetical protein
MNAGDAREALNKLHLIQTALQGLQPSYAAGTNQLLTQAIC